MTKLLSNIKPAVNADIKLFFFLLDLKNRNSDIWKVALKSKSRSYLRVPN